MGFIDSRRKLRNESNAIMKKLYTTLVLVFATLALAGFIFWRYFYLATIALDPIPSEATISVNGQKVVDRTLKLTRGTYEFEIAHEGFRTEKFTAKVGIGSNVTKRVELVALPQPLKLADGPFQSLVTSPDRQTLFFALNDTLYFYSLTAPQPAALVPITPKIANLTSLDWASDFNLALVRQSAKSTTKQSKNSSPTSQIGLYDFKRYDLLRQELKPLDSGIKDTAWLADNSGFVYQFKDPKSGENSLVRANRAGASVTRLLDLNSVNFPIAEPTLTTGPGTTLLLSGNDKNGNSDLYLFDSFIKTPPSPITDSGRVSGPIFSSEKSRLAYLDNGELVVSDSNGKNKRNLSLRPKNNNYTFINPNSLLVFTPNQLTVVDFNQQTPANQSYEIYAPDDKITNLIANPDGKTAYYTYQDKLYQIIIRPL